jgi:hypothetical protein
MIVGPKTIKNNAKKAAKMPPRIATTSRQVRRR